MGQLERRLSKRKVLDRLTYIDMPGGNGGIVTDVSEGGLGFRVVSPLGKIGTVHFLLSGQPNRIAGSGNVVWTDDKRRNGGLSFTEFPGEIREQIRNWPFGTKLRLEPFAGEGLALADFDLSNMPEFTGEETGESYYRQYFPADVLAETPVGKTSRLFKAIGISSLAGVVGLLSYFCYREAHKWSANSKSNAPREHSSEVITPGSNLNSSSEIALLQNTAERSDVGSETLPRVANAESATAEPPDSNEAQPIADVGQTDADEPAILFVQVAAVTQEADAYKIMNELKARQFAAFISPPVNDGFYRVQLGPYQTSEAAHASLKALEDAGYKPYIRR